MVIKSNPSIEDYIDDIIKVYPDINVKKRVKVYCDTYAIISQDEVLKVKEANLLAYAKENDLVTSYKEGCDKLGVGYYDVLSEKDSNKHIALKKLEIIIKALNDGWKPDWNNSNQRKYYTWFDMRNGGFSFYDTTYIYDTAIVCSALLFKSEELTYYCGNMFLGLYKDYYE